MFLYLLLATFCTIFITELIGDKTIYTISSLTLRFNASAVLCGFTLAFMGKMLGAVLVGQTIAELPPTLVTVTSTVTFFTTALIIWHKKPGVEAAGSETPQRSSKAVWITFATIFFSEWGDIGQVTAATLAARYQAPLVIWLGATLALMTKGILAMTLGLGLRNRLPKNTLRFVSVSLCLTMGIISALRLVM
jgi:putative Ca2+/H+ antiporter (TMEM165/GDT1 family)